MSLPMTFPELGIPFICRDHLAKFLTLEGILPTNPLGYSCTYYILLLYLALEIERAISNVTVLVRGFGMVMNTILYLK